MSSEGFLLRFLLGFAAVLAASSLAVGCAVTEPGGAVLGAGQPHGAWATPAELAWLEQLGRWNRCSTELAPAPTARLLPALRTFRRACAELAQGRDATALFREADQMLPPGEVRDLPVLAGHVRFSRIEPHFGRVASRLAGKPVEVRCWSSADWQRLMREEREYTRGQLGLDTLGFAGIGGTRVNLAPAVCGALTRLAYRGVQPADRAGRLLLAAAVVTLSHEPQHTRGISDEAVAECYAIQVAHHTAKQLGADTTYAASLVRTYWRQYDEELPAYRSVECRHNGPLDRGDATSIWR